MKPRPEPLCWADVDLSAIAHNVTQGLGLIGPECRFMAVVKANAYGHGAVPIARAALDAGAHWIGVATVAEAAEFRDAGIAAPILVLGPCLPGDATVVVEHGLTQTVCDDALPEALSRAACEMGRTAEVHVKIDTGMGRLGVPFAGVADHVRRLASLPGIAVTGVFSHFATADEADFSFAEVQLQRFQNCCEELEQAGFRHLIRHIANTGGVLNLSGSHMDMVRPGLLLYGIGLTLPAQVAVALRPALAWKARVHFVRRAEAGETVGYGRAYTVTRPTTLAAVAAGYADGYDRHLSGADVLIHGRRVPVVGRVSMDRIIVDVGGVPEVAIGDEAVLLGKQGAEEITALELAARVPTTVHEIVTRIGARVPRIYLP